MTTKTSELNRALREAEAADDVLAALAAVEYRREHPGADCPAHLVPDVGEFTAFNHDTSAPGNLPESVTAAVGVSWEGHVVTCEARYGIRGVGYVTGIPATGEAGC